MANQYGNFMNRGKEDTLSTYKGQLINKGLGNSIAGIRGSNDLNTNTDKSIADYYNSVYSKNEQSKDDASKQYATGTYQESLDKWKANSEANTSAVSGVSSAVLGAMDTPGDQSMQQLVSSYHSGSEGDKKMILEKVMADQLAGGQDISSVLVLLKHLKGQE